MSKATGISFGTAVILASIPVLMLWIPLRIGFLLGGTVGLGTIAYALAIGPLVQVFIPVFAVRPAKPALVPTTAL